MLEDRKFMKVAEDTTDAVEAEDTESHDARRKRHDLNDDQVEDVEAKVPLGRRTEDQKISQVQLGNKLPDGCS